MSAVQHARVTQVVADGPYHLLQYKTREGLLALHEGEYQVGVLQIKTSHIQHQLQCLVVCVGDKALVNQSYTLLQLADAAELCFVAEAYVRPLIFVLQAQHLADGVQCAQVYASSHPCVISVAEGVVRSTCHPNVQQRGHQTGNILRHSTPYGEDQGVTAVAKFAVGHHLQVIHGLFHEMLHLLGLVEGLGGDDAEVGHWVAIPREVKEHAPFVANALVGEVALGEGGDEAVVVYKWVFGNVFFTYLPEGRAAFCQFILGHTAFMFVEQQFQKMLLLLARQA